MRAADWPSAELPCGRLTGALLSCRASAVMERYTRNARFCLICNYVSKIIPALQSRCTRFRFQPLPEHFVQARLEHICGQERCGRGWRGMGGHVQGAGWAHAGCRVGTCARAAGTCVALLHMVHSCVQFACPCYESPSLHTLAPPAAHPSTTRSIKVTAGGLEALIELGGGDMRRTLNLLQVRGCTAG